MYGYNSARFLTFELEYTAQRLQLSEEKPDTFGPNGQSVEDITRRTIAVIHSKGIKNVNIDSEGFKRTAIRLHIKNTYKAWEEFLKGES